ncbi:MAG: cobalt-precorrin-5B (C(1))-methyltransferase CbiD, partial [Clostridiales bacterium]
MVFDHYIHKGRHKLRMGYSTGSCAALAAKAGMMMLFSGEGVEQVEIITPKGLPVCVEVLDISRNSQEVRCAVRKDGGDDPDATDGCLVYASVRREDLPGVWIDGGEGIGRVTKRGLDQPVEAAAINTVPRRMITEVVTAICAEYNYPGGIRVIISIPGGEKLAEKTFNSGLGIRGGLSILGTTGIVEPQSTQALIDCIKVEIDSWAAEGKTALVLTPGNYGEAFLQQQPDLTAAPTVKYANYVGDAIDFAVLAGFKQILLVGNIGKLVKVAGGIMNTHSAVADCRMEIFAAHAAVAGAAQSTIIELMNAVATDDCLEILDKAGIQEQVLSTLAVKLAEQLQRRAGADTQIAAILYSNHWGELVWAGSVQTIVDSLKKE